MLVAFVLVGVLTSWTTAVEDNCQNAQKEVTGPCAIGLRQAGPGILSIDVSCPSLDTVVNLLYECTNASGFSTPPSVVANKNMLVPPFVTVPNRSVTCGASGCYDVLGDNNYYTTFNFPSTSILLTEGPTVAQLTSPSSQNEASISPTAPVATAVPSSAHHNSLSSSSHVGGVDEATLPVAVAAASFVVIFFVTTVVCTVCICTAKTPRTCPFIKESYEIPVDIPPLAAEDVLKAIASGPSGKPQANFLPLPLSARVPSVPSNHTFNPMHIVSKPLPWKQLEGNTLCHPAQEAHLHTPTHHSTSTSPLGAQQLEDDLQPGQVHCTHFTHCSYCADPSGEDHCNHSSSHPNCREDDYIHTSCSNHGRSNYISAYNFM